MRTGSKEHCDITERHAPITQLSDALCDELRLLVFIMRADNDRRLATLDARIESLLKTLLHIRDDRVRDVENRLRAAEVLFELYDLRFRKELRKLEHVAMTRTAKRIDRLKLVASTTNSVIWCDTRSS